MKIALVLPRNMMFTLEGATSIDLCARDYALASRFRDCITVLCRPVDKPLPGVATSAHAVPGPGARLFGRTGFEAGIAGLAPDVILVEQHTIAAAALARRFPRIPVVLRRHGFFPLKPGRAARLGRRLRPLARIVTVSESVREDAIEGLALPPDRVVTVHNGIDVASWKPAPERDPIIAFAGRLSPQKGVLEAAEACRQVLMRHEDWRAVFYLANPDEYPDYRAKVLATLSDLPQEQVEVAYSQPHDEVKALFQRASIVVMPSVSREPFGLCAIEAFAGGAALVASRFGGLGEVLGPPTEVAGLALNETTRASIAAALEKLIADPALRQEIAASGRRRADRCFAIGDQAGKLDDLFVALAAGASGA